MGLPVVWLLLYKARLRNLAPSYLSLDLSKKCPFISDLFHSFVIAHLTSIITEEKKKFIGMPVFCMLVFVLYSKLELSEKICLVGNTFRDCKIFAGQDITVT